MSKCDNTSSSCGSSTTKVTFHAFPLKDTTLCDKWVRANPRTDFLPTQHSKLCSLHFQSSDFVDDRRDSNAQRRKCLDDKPLVRRYLKKDAVPSIFPKAPQYLSSKPTTVRSTTKATSTSRREQEDKQIDLLEKSLVAADDISDISAVDLQTRLEAETTSPTGFTLVPFEESMMICLLKSVDGIAKVRACITVREDLTVVVSVEDTKISASNFHDLVKGSLKKMSQLTNLMARVKTWSEDPSSRSLEMELQFAVQALKNGLKLSKADSKQDIDEEEHRKLKFLIEQLELLVKHKQGRHYSPKLTIFSYLIYSCSPSAYETLRNADILCLPSTSTLRKITRRVDVNEGLDNSAYLKLRVDKLNAYERNVVLMIDEIYVAKRVEYAGGDVKGLTVDGSVASTLLCFMIKSVAGKYKDVVGIYPMSKLTAAKQHECYLEVMKLIRSVSINVVAISVDNASTNRKFLVDCLCGGNLKTHITDSVTGQPLYLIFDPVHDIKNVYNNFQSRKNFECPEMALNLPFGCTANFQHVVDLFNLESNMTLKQAHRLTPAALKPKSIEKTSVKLATSIFSESTRNALVFYATNEGRSDWASTADFITLILKLWNVLNVKSSSKGKHKRDISMDPVRSSLDWKIDFLREFADFLKRWEESKKPGLTRETFLALRHTCLALADCCSYLMDSCGYKYVLLGNLQSDAIESRFGWLRQLSGANYFISTRQVMESDRKIRALSLLKFSGVSLSEIDDALQQIESASAHSELDKTADDIADELKLCRLPSASDANVIFYVGGYIARSIIRTTRCDHCKECLVTADVLESIQVDEKLTYSASTFLDSINRGGLSRPTDFTFSLAVHCWRVFEEIKTTSALLNQLLSCNNQRTLFTKIMDRANCLQTFGQQPIECNVCVGGHDLNVLVAQRFFNCVAKNLVKELTNKANEQFGQSTKKRRIVKLSSSCTNSH